MATFTYGLIVDDAATYAETFVPAGVPLDLTDGVLPEDVVGSSDEAVFSGSVAPQVGTRAFANGVIALGTARFSGPAPEGLSGSATGSSTVTADMGAAPPVVLTGNAHGSGMFGDFMPGVHMSGGEPASAVAAPPGGNPVDLGTTSATGQATVSGSMEDKDVLAGAIPGIATVAARLTRPPTLTGQSSASATASSTLLRLALLSGTASGDAACSVDVERHILDGRVQGAGAAVVGFFHRARRLVVTSQGSASLTAKLQMTIRSLMGAMDSSSTVTTNMVVLDMLGAGLVEGSAHVAGQTTLSILKGRVSEGTSVVDGRTQPGIVQSMGHVIAGSTAAAKFRLVMGTLLGSATGAAVVTGNPKRVYLITGTPILGSSTVNNAVVDRLRFLQADPQRRSITTVKDTFTRNNSDSIGTPEQGGPWLAGLYPRYYKSTELLNQTIELYTFDSTKRNVFDNRPHIVDNRLELSSVGDVNLTLGEGRIIELPYESDYEVSARIVVGKGEFSLFVGYHEAAYNGSTSPNYFRASFKFHGTNRGTRKTPVTTEIVSFHPSYGSDESTLVAPSGTIYRDYYEQYSVGASALLTARFTKDGTITAFLDGERVGTVQVTTQSYWRVVALDDPAHADTYLSHARYVGIAAKPEKTGEYVHPTGTKYDLGDPLYVEDFQVAPTTVIDPALPGAYVSGHMVLDHARLRGTSVGHARPVALGFHEPGTASYTYENVIRTDRPVAYWRMNDPEVLITPKDPDNPHSRDVIGVNTITDLMPDPAQGTVAFAESRDALIDNDIDAALRLYNKPINFGRPAKLFNTPAQWSYSGWIKPSTLHSSVMALWRGGPKIWLSNGGELPSPTPDDWDRFYVGTAMPFARTVQETEETYADWEDVLHQGAFIPRDVDRAHLGVSYDGEYRKVYIDGELVAAHRDAKTLFYGQDEYDEPDFAGMNTGKGRVSSELGFWVNGEYQNYQAVQAVDEIAIFHSALSGEQFREHYRAGLGLRGYVTARASGHASVSEKVSVAYQLSGAIEAEAVTEYVPLRPLNGQPTGSATVTGKYYLRPANLLAEVESAALVAGQLRPAFQITGVDAAVGFATVVGYERVYPKDFDPGIIGADSYVRAMLNLNMRLRSNIGNNQAKGVAVAKHTPNPWDVHPQGFSEVYSTLRSGSGGEITGRARVKEGGFEAVPAFGILLQLRSNNAGVRAAGQATVTGTTLPKFHGVSKGFAYLGRWETWIGGPFHGQYIYDQNGLPRTTGVPISDLRGMRPQVVSCRATVGSRIVDRLGRINHPHVTPRNTVTVGTVILGVRIPGDMGEVWCTDSEAVVALTKNLIVEKNRFLIVPGAVTVADDFEVTVEGGAAKSAYTVEPTTPRNPAIGDAAGPPVILRRTRQLFV